MLNTTVLQDFNEALQLVQGDRSAAAALTLAAALRDNRPAPSEQNKDALTIAETATRLKVATNTVYGLVEKGELPHHRIGRTIRILPADIDAYQHQNTEVTRAKSRRPCRFDL